jgi:subtilisin family serine protease
MIVMAAAGNDVGFVTAPASWPECLAIAATGITNEPWSGSSRGPQVDFCAPGEGVWAATARRSGDSEEFDVEPHYGTSFAVAHAAGVAALWLAYHGASNLRRRYGKRNVQRLFLSLARDSARRPKGWDRRRFGAGILDARALLEAELPDPELFNRMPARGAGWPPKLDALDRLATLWPDLSKAQVRSRLGAALGKRGKALDEILDRFGGEHFYQYSQDAELRGSLNRPRGAMAAPAGRPETLRRTAASRALTEALNR